jgi:hypothetical protein
MRPTKVVHGAAKLLGIIGPQMDQCRQCHPPRFLFGILI